MKKIFSYTMATTFGLGYLPVSGTFGSMFPIALYIFFPSPVLLWSVFIFNCIVAFPVCDHAMRLFGRKDPSEVVIDEVIGQFIPLLILRPAEPAMIFLTFILFRIFDALKIPPVDLMEKKGGSYGIIMDDVAAGIYTTACVFLLQKL